MERFIWKTMVRCQTLPFESHASATFGQLTWVYLNEQIDYDERVGRIHPHCMSKFLTDTCEICGEPVAVLARLPEDIKDEVYRPGEDDIGTITVNGEPVGFSG